MDIYNELYRDILVNVLSKKEIKVTFPDLQLDAEKIIEMESYKALCR